jgi:hypothetical protein
MKITPPKLQFACPISWNSMAGTDAVRNCEMCGHLVTNLSSMGDVDRTALFQRAARERVCVGYFMRHDGGMVTPERALTKSEQTHVKQFGLVALSVAAMGLAAGCVAQQATNVTQRPPPAETEQVVTLEPTKIETSDSDETILFLVGMICVPEKPELHGPAGK